MKLPSIAIAIIASASCLFAQSAHERELNQLAEQRDKAIAAAVEPINRRYQTALEQLLRRATQGNDLETAVKIKGALKAIGVTPEASSTSVVGKWIFRVEGRQPFERELTADGAVIKSEGGTGTWVIEGKTLKIRYADGATDFELPVRNGKLVGKGLPNGNKIIAEQK